MRVYRGTYDKASHEWQVTVDGNPLSARHDLRNHSPDGFAWGYGGSGPAQLALAICADALEHDQRALMVYQYFKDRVVARFPMEENFVLNEAEVMTAIDYIETSHVS